MATYPCKRHLPPDIVRHGGNGRHGCNSEYHRRHQRLYTIQADSDSEARGTMEDGMVGPGRSERGGCAGAICGRAGAGRRVREKSRNEAEQGCPDRRKSAGNHRAGGWVRNQATLTMSQEVQCSSTVRVQQMQAGARCCCCGGFQLDLVRNMASQKQRLIAERRSSRSQTSVLCLEGRPPQLGG